MKQVDHAARIIPVGSVWKHFKGGIYMVIGHGFDTEREEPNIHYRRVAGPSQALVLFDRPLSSWLKRAEGGQERFTRLQL